MQEKERERSLQPEQQQLRHFHNMTGAQVEEHIISPVSSAPVL